MYSLASDEKTSGVMIYTNSMLIRGDVVSKQSIRISVWLRSGGAPEYFHLLKAQVVHLDGHSIKTQGFPEMYLPTSLVIGFHLTPPAQDAVDYDETEMNRVMQPVALLVGSFIFTGSIRISTQVDLGTSITSARAVWLSLYDVDITNPLLTQMGRLKVPMVLVRSEQVSFGLNE